MPDIDTYDALVAWAMNLDVEEVFRLSTNQQITGTQRSIAYTVARKLRSRERPSFKQLRALKRIYTSAQSAAAVGATTRSVAELAAQAREQSLDADAKHLCLRMAWHDDRWNGKICRRPADNAFCIGEHSLLSERIRRRRDLSIETRPDCAGCKADSTVSYDYQPPCFWSINAFGRESLTFHHDNPIAEDFPHIRQHMPPFSLISWPFKLSFVRNEQERKKYGGNYYPKAIFENRIKLFRRDVRPGQTVVFTYCKFSNPVSAEEAKYLVTGCALLAEQGEPEHFKVSAEKLAATATALRQPNFPTMNWALRFTLDFETTGVRIPYHEYLENIAQSAGITEDLLQEMAVTIDEPELRDGFLFVAKHVDDDQAIYLLTKIRRSLLRVREHGLTPEFDVDEQLERVEDLLDFVWTKRGYLPGLKSLLCSIPGVQENYSDDVAELCEAIDTADGAAVEELLDAVGGGANATATRLGALSNEILQFLQEHQLDAKAFIRLASLNLTSHQFSRLGRREGVAHDLGTICGNPYLLFEEYEPGEITEDELSGQRLDGPIDLFKLDIALMPLAKYQRPLPTLHDLWPTDRRRLRAVMIEILKNRESRGDCYLETNEIARAAEAYPLFYKGDAPYVVQKYIQEPDEGAQNHFREKLVARELDGQKCYYLKNLFDDEVYVRSFITGLVQRTGHVLSAAPLKDGLEEAVVSLQEKIGNAFDAAAFRVERELLYERIASKSFFVIRGSPGAGKSYELLKLVNFFGEHDETHVVLSLTGKAVLRLRNNEEKIFGINAKTIDKFLVEETSAAAQGARRVVHNLIIDESSMIDLPKLAKVFRCVDGKHLKRVILVGDPNQLPPIGFGKPFVDLIDAMEAQPEVFESCGVNLQVNCRAEMGEEFISFTRVFSNESKFAEGWLAQCATEGKICDEGVETVFWKSREELQERIRQNVGDLLSEDGCGIDELPAYLGIDERCKPRDLDRLQVLSPYRAGYFGASGLNTYFQDALRAGTPFQRRAGGDVVFKLLDKVMHTQNEYDGNELFVSNGSLGAVTSEGRVFFTDRDEEVSIKALRHSDMLELAYATTVHKSQGSGFGQVFIVLPEKARFTSRELLYTALTRARNKVTLFIQQGGEIPLAPALLNSIRGRSAVTGRRTTLFGDGATRYAYVPEAGVVVKSRVEYIIHKKLQEAQAKHGSFHFVYEREYEIQGAAFNIHPDFSIEFADGRTIYWEHLGKVTNSSYMRDWDKRRKLYESQGHFDRVVTTDELRGISDEKIESIIRGLVTRDYKSEDASDRYSKMHFSLR